MKSQTITSLFLFTSITTFANTGQTICKNSIDGQIATPGVGEVTDIRNLIKNATPEYFLVGNTYQISDTKQYRCSTNHFSWSDCINGTGSYSFYEVPYIYGYASLKRGFSSNRDFQYTPDHRMRGYVATVVTDKYYTNNNPAYEVKIPMCDAIPVNIQFSPTVSKINMSGGNKIDISISTQIDDYSKNKLEGDGKAEITYYFSSVDRANLNESFNTKNSMVSIYPTYNATYSVQVKVFDGTYSKTITLGNVLYHGGRNCTTCGKIY